MADWPENLPACPILNGFDEQPQPNVGAFKPEVGTPKMRRRSTARGWISNFTFRMTNAQAGDFWGFYIDTLNDGTEMFLMDHPLDPDTTYGWMFDPNTVPKAVRVTPTTQTIQFTLIRLP